MSKMIRGWSVADAAELYAINQWGRGLLSIEGDGDLALHPFSNRGNGAGPGLNLKALVDDLLKRGSAPRSCSGSPTCSRAGSRS